MSNDNQGNPEAIIPGGETTPANTIDVGALESKVAEQGTAISQITARAKRAEEEARAAKAELEALRSANHQVDPIKDELESLRLKVEGFSDEEVAFLKPFGGKKAMENPIVKTAIETIRSQKKAEQAIPEDDSAKSDIERKYTMEQLRQMPASELEKILPHSTR
jgi:hypothetical protein